MPVLENRCVVDESNAWGLQKYKLDVALQSLSSWGSRPLYTPRAEIPWDLFHKGTRLLPLQPSSGLLSESSIIRRFGMKPR